MAADAVLSSLAPAIAPAISPAQFREPADSGYSDRLTRRLFDPPRPTRRAEPQQGVARRPATPGRSPGADPPGRLDRAERPAAVPNDRRSSESNDTEPVDSSPVNEPPPGAVTSSAGESKHTDTAAADEAAQHAAEETARDPVPVTDAAGMSEATSPATTVSDIVRTPALPWGETATSVTDGTTAPISVGEEPVTQFTDPIAPTGFPSSNAVAAAPEIASRSTGTNSPAPPAGLSQALSTAESSQRTPADAVAPLPDMTQADGPLSPPDSVTIETAASVQAPVKSTDGTAAGTPDGANPGTASAVTNADESSGVSPGQQANGTSRSTPHRQTAATQPDVEATPTDESALVTADPRPEQPMPAVHEAPAVPHGQGFLAPSGIEVTSETVTPSPAGSKAERDIAASSMPQDDAPSAKAGNERSAAAVPAPHSDPPEPKPANIAVGREPSDAILAETAVSVETAVADVSPEDRAVKTAVKAEAPQVAGIGISTADGLPPSPAPSTSAGPTPRSHAVDSPSRSAVVTPESLPNHAAAALRAAASFDRPIRIRLSPAELGTLRVEVSRQEGGVSARFEVTNAAAHTALSDHVSALRESLSRAGVPIDRIEIRIAEPRSDDGRRDEQHGSHGGRDGQPDGGRQQRSGDERRQASERESLPGDVVADQGTRPSIDEPSGGSRAPRRSETDSLDIQV